MTLEETIPGGRCKGPEAGKFVASEEEKAGRRGRQRGSKKREIKPER